MKNITLNDLQNMTDTEGLILQGCGGDLQEWIDGVNILLTDEQILRNKSVFTDVSVFIHNGLTNLLFNMKSVDLDVGKLAIWRIATHEQFGGTWLSDYLVNQLGMDKEEENLNDEAEYDER